MIVNITFVFSLTRRINFNDSIGAGSSDYLLTVCFEKVLIQF